MDLHNKYKNFEKRIKFNENVAKDDSETLSSLGNSIDNLNSSQQTQDDSISQALTQLSQHSDVLNSYSQIIDSLENQYYGNSIAELENFIDQCVGEPLYYFGGQAKLNAGTKATNGPFGYLFTRVSPASQFSGVIRLYMSQIPAGVTSTTLNFYINGTSSNLNLNFITNENYNLEISFDFFSINASNIFKMEFTDSLLADTILDFMEIITENGRNFMCLNRLENFIVSSFSTSSNTTYMFMEQLSNVGGFEQSTSPITEITSPSILQLPGRGTPLNINLFRNQVKRKMSLGYYQSIIIQLSIGGENSTLYRTDVTSTNYVQILNNVSFVSLGYHWRNSVLCYCGTLLNQQIFLGGTTVTANDIPTINSVAFPNQFITCSNVEDWKIMYRPENKEIGYVLLHNSGKIFFIPEDDSTYFIEIGLGTQPNAYMQADYETIYIYYHFNNTVYKKELKFNSTANKWELTKNIKPYPGAVEINELYDGCHLRTFVDGTRQVF
ncbi:MAG: hypothetical protein PHR96_00660 [Clostridia bacterium]|nr:hypothetical protein [Clostridia bacterium]